MSDDIHPITDASSDERPNTPHIHTENQGPECQSTTVVIDDLSNSIVDSSKTTSNIEHEHSIDETIETTIDEHQPIFNACHTAHIEEVGYDLPPRSMRFEIDLESVIRKLALYIVLFGSLAYISYQIIQLYIAVMPVEVSIVTILSFAFVMNFDIQRHIPRIPSIHYPFSI